MLTGHPATPSGRAGGFDFQRATHGSRNWGGLRAHAVVGRAAEPLGGLGCSCIRMGYNGARIQQVLITAGLPLQSRPATALAINRHWTLCASNCALCRAIPGPSHMGLMSGVVLLQPLRIALALPPVVFRSRSIASMVHCGWRRRVPSAVRRTSPRSAHQMRAVALVAIGGVQSSAASPLPPPSSHWSRCGPTPDGSRSSFVVSWWRCSAGSGTQIDGPKWLKTRECGTFLWWRKVTAAMQCAFQQRNRTRPAGSIWLQRIAAGDSCGWWQAALGSFDMIGLGQ
jgi:hypothetical protein